MFNYIKESLGDYPKMEEDIKQHEEELRYPYRESDWNAGIKKGRASQDVQDHLMITIEQDQRLAACSINQSARRAQLYTTCN